jgi:hypothetical protein
VQLARLRSVVAGLDRLCDTTTDTHADSRTYGDDDDNNDDDDNDDDNDTDDGDVDDVGGARADVDNGIIPHPQGRGSSC